MSNLALLIVPLIAIVVPSGASAQSAEAERGKSGLPLPRFVSLGSGEANMRSGPGRDYPVLWTYRRKGLPMEVVGEWGIYRRVRDPEGEEGWMDKALLSGARTGLVLGKLATLRARPEAGAPPVLRAEPGVVGNLQVCEDGWCRFQVEGRAGYIPVLDLWGVYEGEAIE